MTSDSTTRFSARVPYYHQFRPRYPQAVLDMLEDYGLTPESVIADIGAGTGISSELFLNYGTTVYAVEPNAEMRAASEHYYGERPNFHVIDGGAEATTLADHSIDLITAGQAFHWFDQVAAKTEFARILRPGGHVALFWNEHADHTSPFVDDYNAVMKRFDVEQGATPRAKELLKVDEDIAEFFAPRGYDLHKLPNPVFYDRDGLLGRALSSSYAPLPGHEYHEEMITAMHGVYDRHQIDGRVRMDYVTRVYVGKV